MSKKYYPTELNDSMKNGIKKIFEKEMEKILERANMRLIKTNCAILKRRIEEKVKEIDRVEKYGIQNITNNKR